MTDQDAREQDRRRAWLIEEARHHRALANHYRARARRALAAGNSRGFIVADHAAECSTAMHRLRTAQADAITNTTNKEHAA